MICHHLTYIPFSTSALHLSSYRHPSTPSHHFHTLAIFSPSTYPSTLEQANHLPYHPTHHTSPTPSGHLPIPSVRGHLTLSIGIIKWLTTEQQSNIVRYPAIFATPQWSLHPDHHALTAPAAPASRTRVTVRPLARDRGCEYCY